MGQEEIKSAVRRRYAAKAAEAAGCGVRAAGDPSGRARRYYAETELDDLPDTVTSASWGCGNPVAMAELKPGQVVLDLGAGGGIDCFLAAQRVGDTGRVIGLDMCAEMVDLAIDNARKLGLGNVQFRLGEIERIPLESDSVDVVISNCVICLCPDKEAVFREARRVLRPGGRLYVSDEAWEDGRGYRGDCLEADWTKCMAGALERSIYLDKVRAAGFRSVEFIEESRHQRYPGDHEGLLSVKLRAIKP